MNFFRLGDTDESAEKSKWASFGDSRRQLNALEQDVAWVSPSPPVGESLPTHG